MYPIAGGKAIAARSASRRLSRPEAAFAGERAAPAAARVLLGDDSVLALAHRALAWWAVHEPSRPQVVLDCGGYFDAYRLGLETRRHGRPAGALLERIWICRAFTGYQEIRALLNLRRRFAAGHRITLLNPLVPLLDEDLPGADRPWLFRRLLDGIACFAREGYAVRVCQRTVSPQSGAGDFPLLPEAAAFERTLARRFPLRIAARGRILGANDGQEHHAVFPRGGSGGAGLRGLPPLPDPRGSGALRQVV